MGLYDAITGVGNLLTDVVDAASKIPSGGTAVPATTPVPSFTGEPKAPDIKIQQQPAVTGTSNDALTAAILGQIAGQSSGSGGGGSGGAVAPTYPFQTTDPEKLTKGPEGVAISPREEYAQQAEDANKDVITLAEKIMATGQSHYDEMTATNEKLKKDQQALIDKGYADLAKGYDAAIAEGDRVREVSLANAEKVKLLTEAVSGRGKSAQHAAILNTLRARGIDISNPMAALGVAAKAQMEYQDQVDKANAEYLSIVNTIESTAGKNKADTLTARANALFGKTEKLMGVNTTYANQQDAITAKEGESATFSDKQQLAYEQTLRDKFQELSLNAAAEWDTQSEATRYDSLLRVFQGMGHPEILTNSLLDRIAIASRTSESFSHAMQSILMGDFPEPIPVLDSNISVVVTQSGKYRLAANGQPFGVEYATENEAKRAAGTSANIMKGNAPPQFDSEAQKKVDQAREAVGVEVRAGNPRTTTEPAPATTIPGKSSAPSASVSGPDSKGNYTITYGGTVVKSLTVSQANTLGASLAGSGKIKSWTNISSGSNAAPAKITPPAATSSKSTATAGKYTGPKNGVYTIIYANGNTMSTSSKSVVNNLIDKGTISGKKV